VCTRRRMVLTTDGVYTCTGCRRGISQRRKYNLLFNISTHKPVCFIYGARKYVITEKAARFVKNGARRVRRVEFSNERVFGGMIRFNYYASQAKLACTIFVFSRFIRFRRTWFALNGRQTRYPHVLNVK